MKVSIPKALRRLETRSLSSHPLLWIMRFYKMIFLGLFGLVVVWGIGRVLPVSVSAIWHLPAYFTTLLITVAVLLSPWVYIQARSAQQLRKSSQARSGLYLLAGYLLIVNLGLLWPFTFTNALAANLAARFEQAELQEDLETIRRMMEDQGFLRYLMERPVLSFREREVPALSDEDDRNQTLSDDATRTIASLSVKYCPHWGTISAISSYLRSEPAAARDVTSCILDAIFAFAAIKDVPLDLKPRAAFESARRWAGRVWVESPWIFSELYLSVWVCGFCLVLLLRVFQATGVRSWLTTLGLGLVVFLLIAFYGSMPSSTERGISILVMAIFVVAATYTLLAPRMRLRHGRVLATTAVNVLTLLLPFMPLTISGILGVDWDLDVYYLSLGAGALLLLVLTLWIERCYVALRFKPN